MRQLGVLAAVISALAAILGVPVAGGATATEGIYGPVVQLDGAPDPSSASANATFSFGTLDEGATFTCALDGAEPAACASPVSYGPLADGAHSFRVQAADALGNAGPAVDWAWTIDTGEPETLLESAPPATSDTATATFAYAATEPAAEFECAVDGGAFADCGDGQSSVGPLGDGTHTFEVRAADRAGNVDHTPAAWKWTIDRSAIRSAEPAAGAVDVSPFTDVRVVFKRAMDPVSITTATFSLWRSDGTQVPAAPFYDAATFAVRLVTTQPLDYAKTYRVRISGVRTTGGVTLEPLSWPFTITATPVSRRINAGATAPYVASNGDVWEADSTFRGGVAETFAGRTIFGTADPALFRDHRRGVTGVGWWLYNVPVPNGTYRVRLWFVELSKSAPGQRVFSVNILDTLGAYPDVYNLDILREVRPNTPLVKTFDVRVTDRSISLHGTAKVDQPEIAGIEIIGLTTS